MSGVIEGAVVVQLDEDIGPIIISPTVTWEGITNKPVLATKAQLDQAVVDFPETARDVLGLALVGGQNITIAPNDNNNTITVSADIPTISWGSIVGKPTFADVAATGSWNSLLDKPSVVSQAALDAVAAAVPEQARDALGVALVAGAGISINVNDAADSIEIQATATSTYTDEAARDAVAGMLAAGTHSGITFTYLDSSDSMSATVAPAWSSVTGKPTFASVATSGSYTDLLNKPTFSSFSTMRSVSANTTAVAGEILKVNASGGARTITPPASPSAGTSVLLVKTDSSTNAVTWSATVNGDVQGARINSEDVSGTFVYDGTEWLLTAVNTAFSGAGVGGGAPSVHTHGLVDLTATGTKDNTTYLRGDNTWATPPSGGTPSDASTSTKGIVQLSGDLGGTATTPVVTRRGPILGVQTPSYASSLTLNAANGTHHRVTATGNVTVNAPTNPVDGQRLMIEVLASGADRTVTFVSGIETSQAVPGRVFTVPSTTWGYFVVVYRSSTWRLVHAEPQSIPAATPSGWTPADHGLLAWTADPATTVNSIAISTDGTFLGSVIKLDQGATVSNVVYAIFTAGVGLTASRCYIGLYSIITGSLLAQTADQSTTWTTTGVKTTPLVSPVALAAGEYLIGHIAAGTTKPVFNANSAGNGLASYGRTGTSYRGFFSSEVNTSMPATRPATSSPVNPIFFGLS